MGAAIVKPTEGIVIREHRGVFDVETRHGIFACALRSRMKKALIYPERDDQHHSVEQVGRIDAVNPVAIGDRVRVVEDQGETGAIEEVLPRRSKLSRLAPGKRRMEQIMIANADHLVAVFSVRDPRPNLQLLDRLLVAAEAGNLAPVICLNKIDLSKDGDPDIAAIYERCGFRVIPASAVTGEGVDLLKATLRNRVSAIAGPSGAGKTSLLNAMQPGLGLRVREVNRTTGRGRHTTTYLAAHRLDAGGLVIDSPGIREFSLWDVSPRELPELFPEMRGHLAGCRFHDCTHVHEPDCTLRAAVATGDVSRERYDSYVALRKELDGGRPDGR
ncbi:MAG: ribosome small subunit-dependent GTPase A [Gemmatimonadetes bacterium]|nr:ribosome small subunit-dependent GTPase A [Gemmatimonadota bacterium]